MKQILSSCWFLRALLAFALLVTVSLPASAAARFWVGGTGTWDASDTTHWAATTGGAGGQSVPSAADTVTFDGSSGGGTVTVNTTVTIQGLTTGAFTGTLDFSANNNSVTITGVSGHNGSGTGTRTLNLGNGTWTLSATSGATLWTMATTTGLTFNANSSTINLSGTGADTRGFAGGGLTYNAVSFSGGVGGITLTGANTFSSLTISAPNAILMPASATNTITTLTVAAGTPSSPISFFNSSGSAASTISMASGSIALTWAALRRIAFTGGATFTATNTLDYGLNTGITITPPSAGGGGGGNQIRPGIGQ